MRNVYLVAYDIAETKRRTKVFHRLKGYGEAVQYSLFRCVLSVQERLRLRAELWDQIDHGTDRILIIDLGPDDGRGQHALDAWGKALVDPASHDGVLVI